MSGGSIISEFPKGMPPLKQHFPARNRIISGLSRATLVIEAKQKSGSLITARFAIEQGREVFAVPGSIFEEKQQGTNQLIAQGAQPILSADDLLEKLHMIPYTQSHIAPPTLSFSSPEEETLFHLLKDIRSIDQIVHDAALPISQLNQLLILMEMKGLIRHLGGMMYTRV
jgi:DNA processing protein